MRYLLALALLLPILPQTAGAQNLGGAQDISVNMEDVVLANIFSPVGGGGGATGNVSIPINGINSLSAGMESNPITVELQCTYDYDISISTSSPTFTYTGNATTGTTMRVEDVLSLKITDNQTGGSITNGFTQYKSINGTQSTLSITSGQRGVSSFSFQYMAQPGFNYPGGTYVTDIIFTLTKK